MSDCQIGEHYDSTQSKCVIDDLANCGSTGYNCAERVAQWSNGKCTDGVCTVSECKSGYQPVNNVCMSNCKTGEHYDSAQSKCVEDDISNCGSTGYDCAERVAQWAEGDCVNGVCTVTKCQSGYKVVNNEVVKNVCMSDCQIGEHYDNASAACVQDDIFNCGSTGYNCTERVAQWVEGDCVNGVCTVSKCESGYKVKDVEISQGEQPTDSPDNPQAGETKTKTCVSDCKTGEHYDSDQAKCIEDNIDNCGATGRKCLEQIKNSSKVECEAGDCIVTECMQGYKVSENACASNCIDGEQYYDSDTSKCSANNLNNCGMKGFDCSQKVERWQEGKCSKGSCIIEKCIDGFKPVNNVCIADCGNTQYYDSISGECKTSDVNNCGTTGYKCSERVAHWADGSCTNNVCTVNKCDSGYKVANNTCASDCKTNEHYDSNQAKCDKDDVNNCGATDRKCSEEIKNSKTVSCNAGKCSVSACNNGYTLTNNMCVSSCTNAQYYDSTAGSCKSSDENNCGQKGYKCSEKLSNWKTGTCENNSCVIKTCNDGFKVLNNECKADCGNTQYYDSASGSCKTSDLNNCGSTGYKCSERVAHWADGSCTNNTCTLSSCDSGYKVANNACASDCTTGQHYDSNQAKCVPDDKDNCGATGHSCSEEIKNSKSVSCTAGKCVVSACNDGYTKTNNMCVSSCTNTQYYDSTSGSCKNSDENNCGQKGYKCSTKISNWKTGECSNNACVVNSCNDGFKVLNNECKADCGNTQYYDSASGSCKTSDVNNCGSTGYKCSERVAHWADGSCTNNICTLSSCDSGYKVANNVCASDCKTGEHYDSNQAKCVADDPSNCGATGHSCSEEIKNSKSVSCTAGKCVVSACNDGYTKTNNTCVSSCTNSQYYDSTTGSCKNSDENNCGQKGYKCSTKLSNWKTGECSNNSCVLSTCNDGFKVLNNECKADCGNTQYYDSASGTCKTSDVNNCGSTGYKCSERVAHWATGSCTNNICTLSSCENGYKVANNACASDCQTNQHYDSNQAKCVADDVDNCGATGRKCSEEIKNSKTVTCSAGKCSVSECNSGYTKTNNMCVSSCTNTQYYDSDTGSCKTSDLNNCGQKGYKCSTKVSNWKTGDCTNNSCILSACNDGFRVLNNECKADCGSTKFYDSETGSCVTSDLANCGMKGYQCASQIQNWNAGECLNNICKVTTCTQGYKPSSDNKSCVSDCTIGQHYDSNLAKCVADDTSNCGATGHSCSEEIKNSKTVACNAGKCSVSECNSGYTKTNNMCVSSCTDTQYYDSTSGSCQNSNTDNCGQKGYKCSEKVSNWNTGTCQNNACVVGTCKNGFQVIGTECRANCGANQYYDNSTGSCQTSNLQNCGMKGYDCSAISGWTAGTCTSNVCTASSCTTPGYHLKQGKCIADSNLECGTGLTNCSATGKVCIAGACELNNCSNNQTLCSTQSGKACVNINGNDVNNCGGCGFRCADYKPLNTTVSSCDAGVCKYACTGDGFVNISNSTTASGIQCVNANSDNNHCGATGPQNTGERCENGVCSNKTCQTNCVGTTLCGSTCVDINNDPNHCGTCQTQCTTSGNHVDFGACINKVCRLSCLDGYYPNGDNTACVECTGNSHCSSNNHGHKCVNNACGCEDSNDCPDTYTCNNGTCEAPTP